MRYFLVLGLGILSFATAASAHDDQSNKALLKQLCNLRIIQQTHFTEILALHRIVAEDMSAEEAKHLVKKAAEEAENKRSRISEICEY